MSKDRQTFVDPETGEEIESTKLARTSPGLTVVLISVFNTVCIGVIYLMSVQGGPAEFPLKLLGWLCATLVFWLLATLFLMRNVPELKEARKTRFSTWIHDSISRYQHRRRQRILRSQDDQAVPDTALSRAQPPGEPTPTDAALSIADEPDEPERLSVEVEEDTAETTVEQTP